MLEVPFPNVTQLAIPAFAVLIFLELWALKRVKKRYGFETRYASTNLMMGVGNGVTSLLFGFVAYGVLTCAYEFRIWTIGFEWYWILACFIIDDARYYFYHRIAHRYR